MGTLQFPSPNCLGFQVKKLVVTNLNVRKKFFFISLLGLFSSEPPNYCWLSYLLDLIFLTLSSLNKIVSDPQFNKSAFISIKGGPFDIIGMAFIRGDWERGVGRFQNQWKCWALITFASKGEGKIGEICPEMRGCHINWGFSGESSLLQRRKKFLTCLSFIWWQTCDAK